MAQYLVLELCSLLNAEIKIFCDKLWGNEDNKKKVRDFSNFQKAASSSKGFHIRLMEDELVALKKENELLKKELEEAKRVSHIRKRLLSAVLHKYYNLKTTITNKDIGLLHVLSFLLGK